MSVLSNDVNQLESFLSDGINSALRIGVMVLGIGVIMASLNPQLALVALLLIRSSLGIMKPRVSIVLSETDYCSRI